MCKNILGCDHISPYVNFFIIMKSMSNSILTGIEHVGGNMLVSIPKTDAIMLMVKSDSLMEIEKSYYVQ